MLTLDIKRQFVELASALSPENLSCDGELRGKRLIEKKRRLEKQWTALEMQIGRTVDESEVWGWCDEVYGR